MPELTAAAVEQYTQGRLHRDDTETLRMLSLGLAAARRHCGWHVSPVIDDEQITLDGPGGRLLALPTLRLDGDGVTEIVEDGTALDISNLEVSKKGMVRKRSGAFWTRRFSGLVVTMTHGYADADDFNAAVLSLIDRASFAPAGGRMKAVGPFVYDIEKAAGGWTEQERSWLAPFRLERPA